GRMKAGAHCDRLLYIEHETILAPVRDQMQPRANLLQAPLAVADQPSLLGGDQPASRELAPARSVAGGARDPQQDVQVAQASGALLDVGFQAIGRLVVLRVALALLENLRLKIRG